MCIFSSIEFRSMTDLPCFLSRYKKSSSFFFSFSLFSLLFSNISSFFSVPSVCSVPLNRTIPLNRSVPLNRTVPLHFTVPLKCSVPSVFSVPLNCSLNLGSCIYNFLSLPRRAAVNFEARRIVSRHPVSHCPVTFHIVSVRIVFRSYFPRQIVSFHMITRSQWRVSSLHRPARNASVTVADTYRIRPRTLRFPTTPAFATRDRDQRLNCPCWPSAPSTRPKVVFFPVSCTFVTGNGWSGCQ